MYIKYIFVNTFQNYVISTFNLIYFFKFPSSTFSLGDIQYFIFYTFI